MYDFDDLVATFWAHFGCGAAMPFEQECIGVARREEGDDSGLGYYRRVETKLGNDFWTDEQVGFARNCCERAGRLARALAVMDGEGEISALHFRKACIQVQNALLRAHRIKYGRNGPGFMAGICG